MFSRSFSFTLKVCALLVLPVLIAAGVLLSGPIGFGPGEPQSAEATNLNEIKKLLASDAQADDFFGINVAVSGDTAVIGASSEDAGGNFAGAAYVFQRNQGGADNWGQVKKLTASDAQAFDYFGYSVAVSGDTAVIGAYREDAGGTNAGAAYVFQRDQGGADNWGELKKLTASDAQADDRFGVSVAVSGDTAVVGAYLEDGGGSGAGAAFVFERNQGGADNWGEVKKLTASDAQAGDFFGWSVAASGDTAVVGARGDDAGGGLIDNFGAAYVFKRNQGGADNWGQVKKLVASDAQVSDLFGISVAVSGDTAVIGAYHEDAGGFRAGAVYVFQRDQGGADNWGEVKKLTASDAQADDNFGISVAVSGGTAVVGAWQWDAAGSAAGAAYVIQRDQGGAGNWGEVKKLTASDAQAGDLFGYSVVVSGDTAVVGAFWEDAGGSDAGAAYVFDLLQPKPTAPATPTPTPCPGGKVPANGGCGTPTPTPTPEDPGGSAMSMSISPTIICPDGKNPGDVCVEQGTAFTVTVSADAIPAGGYIAVQVWIQYGATGLVCKTVTVLWPDLSIKIPTGGGFTATSCNAGGVTGPFTGPAPSFHKGDLFSFSFNCTAGESQGHVLVLEPIGGPNAGPAGSGYADGTTKIPATGPDVVVNCTDPPPKLPFPGDTDGDGCPDTSENRPKSELSLGGGRDYLNPWDYYDVDGDGDIDLFGDILGVIAHFSLNGLAPYDVIYDRGPTQGPNSWNLTAPDGVIDLFTDVLGVIKQYTLTGCT